MKKKHKIFFIIILLASLASVLGLIIFIYTKSSGTKINQNNETKENTKPDKPNKPDNPDNPDKPIEKSDFVKSSTNINFKLEQKIYLLDFANGVSFNVNEFKYYFINEFNKLGPKANKINFAFNYDNPKHAKQINVSYKGDYKTYFWYFNLN